MTHVRSDRGRKVMGRSTRRVSWDSDGMGDGALNDAVRASRGERGAGYGAGRLCDGWAAAGCASEARTGRRAGWAEAVDQLAGAAAAGEPGLAGGRAARG